MKIDAYRAKDWVDGHRFQVFRYWAGTLLSIIGFVLLLVLLKKAMA